jgi:isoleucyl-tRNA synthetase
VESSYELEKLTGLTNIDDLHRDKLDHIVITKNGKQYKRISEIFDCWFESGAMPYASVSKVGIVELLRNSLHGIQYDTDSNPFIRTSDGLTHQILPADFIAEGIDQTRGWFYTLLVLSASLFDMIPFKNVIVNGLILAEDGKKMSKRLKNYPDPLEIINEYGSDCLRLYLLLDFCFFHYFIC